MTLRTGMDLIAPTRGLEWADVGVAATENWSLLEPIPMPQQMDKGEGWQAAGCRLEYRPGILIPMVPGGCPIHYTHVVIQRFEREVDLTALAEWGNYRTSVLVPELISSR